MRTSDDQLHCAFRFAGVQATSTYPGEALAELRAMDVLRGRENEVFAARILRDRIRAPSRGVSPGAHMGGHWTRRCCGNGADVSMPL